MDINVNGVFYGVQAASKYMLKQGKGSIIITSSISGHVANRPQSQAAVSRIKSENARPDLIHTFYFVVQYIKGCLYINDKGSFC